MEVLLSKAILNKAFGGDVQNGMTHLIQLTDPTRIWSPYGTLGIFGQTYLFRDIGFVVGYGSTAVRLNCNLISTTDMLGSVLNESERHQALNNLCIDVIGEYPSDNEGRLAWFLKLVDICTPEVLRIGLQCALSVSMKTLFEDIITQYRFYFPDEKPSFAEELGALVLTDYCQLFDTRLTMLLIEKKMSKPRLQ